MPVTIYVSKGSFGTPPYKFYSDNNGYQELNNLALDPSKSYLFKRLYSASSHPFYISDIGWNKALTEILLLIALISFLTFLLKVM